MKIFTIKVDDKIDKEIDKYFATRKKQSKIIYRRIS